MLKLINLSVLLFLLVSCDPFDTIIENDSNKDAAIHYIANNIKTPEKTSDTLNIVTWNIKFGGGRIDFFFDCYGDRVIMKKEEVLSNLEGLVKKIKQMNPDVLYLQEVDLNSKRSAYIDQLQWILDNTDLNYAYYGSQWRSDYIPSDGIGKMNSGSAILCKYKLTDGERIPLPLIKEQSGIVQYFYLRRNILKAKTTINGKDLWLITTHTSAYSTDGTRLKQLQQIKEEVSKLDSQDYTFILGGDFNTIPPNSHVYENFADSACADDPDFAAQSFKDELDYMKIFFDCYEPAITQDRYDDDNARFYSFTSDKNGFWNRKLDYIFTNGDFIDSTGMVHQDISTGGMETMPLSDHAPLSVSFILK